jgi:hypothetical protein
VRPRRGGSLSSLANDPAPGVYVPEPWVREPVVTACCARCRRGTREMGYLPCGYNLACPNPKCLHAAHPVVEKTFDHLNQPQPKKGHEQ